MDLNAALKKRWRWGEQNPCLHTVPRECPQPNASALAILVMHFGQPPLAPPALHARVAELPCACLALPDQDTLPDIKVRRAGNIIHPGRVKTLMPLSPPRPPGSCAAHLKNATPPLAMRPSHGAPFHRRRAAGLHSVQ
ncbi:hypothetical protein NDU88_008043 [Pleurodeles waltl]|uniref:Uncharacterized protein n=1 Tax=Pleurodeles waltl TaxID=8319 RepID=A0AAV7QRG0_PLEWA|nr:hypothetical protein NDU88_008043 [Pleurodeles waltl]